MNCRVNVMFAFENHLKCMMQVEGAMLRHSALRFWPNSGDFDDFEHFKSIY